VGLLRDANCTGKPLCFFTRRESHWAPKPQPDLDSRVCYHVSEIYLCHGACGDCALAVPPRQLILVSVAQLIPSLHLHAADQRARLDTSTRTRWHVHDAGRWFGAKLGARDWESGMLTASLKATAGHSQRAGTVVYLSTHLLFFSA
jgi:hypothetical protein